MDNTFLYKSYRVLYRFDQWRKRRFTVPGLAVLYTIFITAIVGMDTHVSRVHQAFTLLLAVLVLAFIWSKFRLRVHINVTRDLPRYATAGKPLVYDVEFSNLAPKKLQDFFFYENLNDPRPTLEELSTISEPGEEKRNFWDRRILYYRWLWIISKKRILTEQLRPVPAIAANGKLKLRVAQTPQNRGFLRFYGVDIVRPDPLGLCNARCSIASPQKLVVLPKRYPVPSLRLPGARKHHALGVSLASSIGNHEEFVSLREYRPGDSLRHIHWRSSAKRGELIIKEYQDEYYVRHGLLLDTFTDIAFSDLFEEAVAIAASFVCALQTQEALMDLIFVGDQAYRFSSGRGTASVDHLLEILAAVQVCRHKPFDAIVPTVMENLHQFSSCICVLLQWDEARRAFIGDLVRRGVPVLVLVVAADDLSGPVDPGPMKHFENRFHVLKIGAIEKGLAQL